MSEPEPKPVAASSWEWLTEDQQVKHLMQSHGYRDGYFSNEDETSWTDKDTEKHFRTHPKIRDEYHDGDHRDYPEGGGGDTLHTHSLVHPDEVEAAVESIKQSVRRAWHG